MLFTLRGEKYSPNGKQCSRLKTHSTPGAIVGLLQRNVLQKKNFKDLTLTRMRINSSTVYLARTLFK